MITNKTFTILPFYDTVEKQWHRIYGKDFTTCPVISPKNRLLPWEIKRIASPYFIQHIYLVDMCNGEAETEITSLFSAGQITYQTLAGNDYIQYLSSEDLLADLPCGYYYLKVNYSILTGKQAVNTYVYSEVFEVRNFTDTPYQSIIITDGIDVAIEDDQILIG